MKKMWLAALAVVLMTGCAAGGGTRADAPREVDVKVVDSVNSTESAQEANPDEVVCTRRHQVGTNFPRTICKTRREMEAERRSAEQELRRQNERMSSQTLRHASGGG